MKRQRLFKSDIPRENSVNLWAFIIFLSSQRYGAAELVYVRNAVKCSALGGGEGKAFLSDFQKLYLKFLKRIVQKYL